MTSAVTGQSPAAFEFFRQKARQLVRQSIRFFLASVLAFAAGIVFTASSNDVEAASDVVAHKLRMQELRTANRAVLMMTPVGMHFPIAITPAELGKVSCQYEINRGPSLEELLNALDNNIVEYRSGPMKTGSHIGIIFKADRRVIREFYFDDVGNPSEIIGASGEEIVMARVELLNQLRALVMHRDIELIKDVRSKCPHK